MKESVLVSACLIGLNTKYNGGNNYNKKVDELLSVYNVIPICPEILGGLSTPRKPSEIKNDRVVTIDGKDVTENFIRGANEVLYLVKKYNIKKAVLKSKSPSCGYNSVYDGTFTNTLVNKNGILTELLIENGVEIISV